MRVELLVLAVASTACISSASYGTARTLAPGDVEHVLGADAYFFTRARDGDLFPTPPWPSYGLRVGLVERLDIGARVTFPRAELDVKYNFFRSEFVDLSAAAHSFFVMDVTSDGDDPKVWLGFEALALADLVAGEGVVVVPAFGPLVLTTPEAGEAAIGLRAGLGLRLDLTDFVALHPDASVLIDPAAGPRETVVGFAVILGDVGRGRE